VRKQTIGVVGAGVMGASVCEDLLGNGFPAILVDVSDDILHSARAQMRKSMRARAMLGQRKTGQPVDTLLEYLTLSTDYGTLGGADLVVENVTEDMGVKRSVYERLDTACHQDCILIANTSCIPIGRLASFTRRPDKVIGVHFMNPVPLKSTVEMIASSETSEETRQRTSAMLDGLGKQYIVVNDSPGFVSNRVLMLTINEAISVVHEQVADAERVDAVFKSCFGHRMGPLETADLIGLDTILNSLLVLLECFGDEKFRPCPLLREMVDAGQLGRKSGRGFFPYA
jgi:3-hydroxybutyryl-CoA dehydrogenase